MSPHKFFFAIAALLVFSGGQTHAGDDPWYYTAKEMEIAYKYQQDAGERLGHPLNPEPCLLGKQEFVASYHGKQFSAPCRFITETIRHLKEILGQGAARYLFGLDVDRAYLAVPEELWEKKYSKLPAGEILPAMLREPSLAAMYHPAGHLLISDSKTDRLDPIVPIWNGKNDVVAFYDGSPVMVLLPDANGFRHGDPAHYTTRATVYFLANRLGEVLMTVDAKTFIFDISFDDEAAVGTVSTPEPASYVNR